MPGHSSRALAGMLSEDGRGTVIEFSVRPRAGKCRVVEASDLRIRISVSAPPEDGRATEQAIKTLADALGIPASSIELLKGRTSRHKTALVPGMGAQDCLNRLRAAVR
ncbi:MAG TPA: DUF167 domain-containing protein [Myxococcota bacterium]|nr:DUF167 domain-containing protein [Myxococcota bacterium]HOD06510.1 DUF167 domain-containing protein [Myxococcota bacterium]HPB49889.1 DUF167 domain-containing protein [Myxococcota bacterium]HQP94972.1 DUF167 domain-containing protein [Myxococcota bacterium]